MAKEYNLIALYEQFYGAAATQALKNISTKSNAFEVPDIPDTLATAAQAGYAALSNAVGYPIFMPVMIDDYWLPNEPLVELAREKRIVRTPLTGADGTIKENMGLGDWEIVIRGVATVDNFDAYPVQAVKRIHRICEKKESVRVIGPLFEYLRIYRIAISRFSLPDLPGTPNAQPYTIHAFSDIESDIVLKRLKNA